MNNGNFEVNSFIEGFNVEDEGCYFWRGKVSFWRKGGIFLLKNLFLFVRNLFFVKNRSSRG